MIASSGRFGGWAFAPRPRQPGAAREPEAQLGLPHDEFYHPVARDPSLDEFLVTVTAERRPAARPWQFRLSHALWCMAAAACMFAVARLFGEHDVYRLAVLVYGALLCLAPLLVFVLFCVVPTIDGRLAAALTVVVLMLLLLPLLVSSATADVAAICVWWLIQAAGIAAVWQMFRFSRRADL